jgi:hypothetical protein
MPARLPRHVPLMRRDRRLDRTVTVSDEDRPLPGLRHPVTLSLEDARPSVVALRLKDLRVQRPQFQHGRDLLKRDPRRPERHHPPERLHDEQRPGVLALRGVLSARVLAGGHLHQAGDDVLHVTAPATLPGHAPRLARRGGDETVAGIARGIESGDVGLDARMPRSFRRGARCLIPLNADLGMTERAESLRPAARTCEEVDDPHASSSIAFAMANRMASIPRWTNRRSAALVGLP